MKTKNKMDFAREIGVAVLEQYGLEDGADLAYCLLDGGMLSVDDTVSYCAAHVAQLIEQA